MPSRAVWIVVLLVLVAPPARADEAFKVGLTVTKSLVVERTWVFCDEETLGAFAIGKSGERTVWVKFKIPFRWAIASHVKPGTQLDFRGKVKGPRIGEIDAVQVDDAELIAVGGRPLAKLGAGVDYASFRDGVFDTRLAQSKRLENWNALKGKRFTDVGVVRRVKDDGKSLELDFVSGAGTHGRITIGRRLSDDEVTNQYLPQAHVLVAGIIEDYVFRTKTVVVKGTDTAAIPNKTGVWPEGQGATRGRAHVMGVGDICEATDEIALFRDMEFTTKMEAREKLVGTLAKGERFEIRRSDGFFEVDFFIVSHKNPQLRGWASKALVEKAAKIVRAGGA